MGLSWQRPSSLKFDIPPVSKWFKFDWHFAMAFARLPMLRPASFVIAVMPALVEVARTVPLLPIQNFWILWSASVAYLAGSVIARARAPSLVKDYSCYREFEDKGHSHRWIVWLFRQHLDALEHWERIVRETVDKGLSYQIAPHRSPVTLPQRTEQSDTEVAKHPINHKRDIHLPLWLDGSAYLLSIRENDPDRDHKVKELFWITFTEAARSRPLSRFIVWFLFAVAFAGSFWSILSNIGKAVTAIYSGVSGQ